MLQPGKDAADLRIVMRRAFAGEIGQEGNARGSLQRVAEFRRKFRSALARDMRMPVQRIGRRDRMTPIWCQVLGMAWQKACTALAGFGR